MISQSDSVLSKKALSKDRKDLNFLQSRLPNIFTKDSSLGHQNFSTTNKTSNSSISEKDSSKLKKNILNNNSLPLIVKGKLNLNKDSLLKKNEFLKSIRKIIPAGTISLGYDYGFLPYTVNMPSPASAISSEGRVSLNVLNIPIEVSYFYSSQKNLIGLNNYFRISYDADRYKDQLNNKLIGSVDKYKNQLGGLQTQCQQLMQKMAYTDYLSSTNPDKWPTEIKKPDSLTSKSGNSSPIGFNNTDSTKQIPKYNKSDSTQNIPKYGNSDSTSYANNFIKTDSLKNNKYLNKADSVQEEIKTYKHKTDSVKDLYEGYKKQYDSLNDSIKRTQKKIDAAESLTNGNYSSYLKKIPFFNKIQNFLSGVKKFEIGLCYPNYSTFLTNNVPVRGINFEYGKNDIYFAFTYGTTVSTLLYNNKSAEGFLQNVQNSYNYFDFSNVSAGRKIISAKLGIGTKEGNHFFVGVLFGKGQSSFINSSANETNSGTIESNVVIEADGKYKISKNTTFDFILGKSSVREEDLSSESISASMKEIFSNYRSYALLTKLNTKINLTKTNLTFTFRWVDPFFKSFGIGFIRSDNMRYEVKLDQPLFKKWKYTGMFRYEEDNLLKLMNYKNQFYSINNTVSCKIKRGLMIRVSYTPLFRTLSSETYSYKNNNSIAACVITFTPKSKKTSMQFNFLYNYYLVNTDTQQINFQNIAYYHQISFKNGFKTGFNLSWFKNTLRDSINNNVFLGVLDVGYQFKNGSSVSVAGKSAYKLNETFYPGFILKANVKIYKSFYWENSIEKFIVGDLFNGYDFQNLKNFPYYCSTRLIYNF